MDETKWFAFFAGGIACLFAALALYGLITDLRRGRTGILMVILSPCIVAGLFFHDTLAIVSTILFAAIGSLDC